MTFLKVARLVICIFPLLSTTAWAEDVVLPLPPEDEQALAKRLGPHVVGEALPCKPIDDPSTLFPFHEEQVTYKFTSGKNTGKTQTFALTKVDRPNGKFVWRVQLAPTLVGYLRQAKDGEIEMPAVEDTGEGMLVLANPGNPFLPKHLKPGETRTYSQKVSVRYVDDLTDEQYSGTLKTDYTYVGTYRLTVPAGTFDAILMRNTVDGKVGPAKNRGTSYNLFAPGVGLVAMILQQKVSAFWIYNIDAAGGKVLVKR